MQCLQPSDEALTAEGAEVDVRLQPSDQGVDIRVMELQAFQKGDGPILPSGLQQIQQVPLGERASQPEPPKGVDSSDMWGLEFSGIPDGEVHRPSLFSQALSTTFTHTSSA